jgi:hypothetical protein
MTKFLKNIAEAIDVALAKLHDIQFSAPWKANIRGC